MAANQNGERFDTEMIKPTTNLPSKQGPTEIAAGAAPAVVYEAGSLKKFRRTKAAMQRLRATIVEELTFDNPQTVRGVFYRLVSRGVIDKTENEYQGVIRLLTAMRLQGELPFAWLADNSRWMRKPRTYDSMEQCLRHTARTYRRSLWVNLPVYVEVWLEKEALASVVYEVTDRYDVPLMVPRGYSSLGFLYAAAEAIAGAGVPAHLYYLGDHDPSGMDITRNIEKRIREFAPDADIFFERIAVTPEQILIYDLPTRPTKKSDSRSKNWEGGSVEVDALPGLAIRDIVREHIEQHLDDDHLEQLEVVEQEERKVFRGFAKIAGDWDEE